MLPTMTDDDRARYLAMTHEKTKALIANLPNMKTDWLDDETWQDMARDRGLKLPAMYLLPTPTAIRRWLRRLGMTNAEFREWGGYATLEDFARLNPRWPLRALVGILLEYVTERDYARDLLRGKLSAKG